MLTGRESLRRVIGRRRRFLPNRNSILSSTHHEIGSSPCDNAERFSVETRSDGAGDVAESVDCPICKTQLPGQDNAFINSHLDECLARGTKRKLGQLTLLQLNFSKSKVKVCSSQLHDGRNQDVQCYPKRTEISETVDNLEDFDSFEQNDNNQSSTDRENPYECQSHDFPTNEVNMNTVSASPLTSETEGSKYVLGQGSHDCDISEVFILTFIVGRRYSNREELHPGSRLCLSRDPENVKDSNAIKVHYADCEYNDILGYIPREVAKHLAPLIDKFKLMFEGSIISLPKDPRAAIPVQIACKNVQSCDNYSNQNMEELKDLWKHFLCSPEFTISDPPRMIRYQQNMVLLIHEVLKSNSHLFTTSEKSFLEAFDSLSDDCQRLFARLYTRKGPWFRVSNISYPEIADCYQAVTGLLEAGYMSSFQWSEADADSLQEVLDVLHKNELLEASLVLNKVLLQYSFHNNG